MNARRGALLAALVCTALLGAGCNRPTDSTAQSDRSSLTPSGSAPAGSAMAPSNSNSPASTAMSPAPSSPMANAGDRAAGAADDTALTAKVKAALVADPALKAMPIDVVSSGAVVTLTGTVESAVDKAKAVQVAENVAGVKSVVDNLSAKS